MKFTELVLKNFQRHKKLAVRFSPTITTILGESDVGKSAILRALRWACQNVPNGDDFIRKGAEEVEVQLTIENSTSKALVVRKKGKENLYQLEGREYRSFGTTVPDDIAKALQVGDINFQGQHDSPFWFNESAAEVSRRLNAVIDLSIIDEALTRIAATVRTANERKELCNERLLDIQKEQSELAPQQERIDQFSKLYEKHQRQQKLELDSDRLESRIQLFGRYQAVATSASQQSQDAENLLEKALAARKLEKKADLLEDLVVRIRKASAVRVPPDFRDIVSAYSLWCSKEEEIESLHLLIQAVGETVDEAAEAEAQAKRAETIFHKKTKGERCPLCQHTL